MTRELIEHMQFCLSLAEKGKFLAPPNPFVGAVLVHNDIRIADGFHAVYGGPHAEKACLDQVSNQKILSESTLFVNLEPCSHFGKTPPCADLIINKGIKKVVIANRDSNPKVSGQGIEKLRAAGIEVIENVLYKEARYLNRRFFTFHGRQRPYVILKWAQTSDGFIADANFHSKWISSETSREMVHVWRAEEAAIVVGTNTAKIDNPSLTARPTTLAPDSFRQPLRIFLDRNLLLSSQINLYDQRSKTIILNQQKDALEGLNEFIKIDFEKCVATQILAILYAHGITSLIVEGGTKLLTSFISSNLYDEARVFVGPKIFVSGVRAPVIEKLPSSESAVAEDILRLYKNHEF